MKDDDWRRIPGLFNKREIEQLKKPGMEYYEEPRGKDSWGQDLFAVYFKIKGGE